MLRTEGADRIRIKVYPDCRVQVAAPVHTVDADVLAAVKKRSRWIYQQLRDFSGAVDLRYAASVHQWGKSLLSAQAVRA